MKIMKDMKNKKNAQQRGAQATCLLRALKDVHICFSPALALRAAVK